MPTPRPKQSWRRSSISRTPWIWWSSPEGVETEAQLAVLRRLECDQAVGFYFSKPLPAEQLTGAGYMGRQ